MKTISNFYEQTILESINLEGYKIPKKITMERKINFIYLTFKSEYVHENNKHLPNEKLFCEWLQGLPSCLNIPFMNYEILENAKNAGFFNIIRSTIHLDSTKTEEEIIATGERLQRKENYFLDNYFMNLSMAFFNLKRNK